MEYTILGSTGMEVSELCLGCLSFGTDDWMLDREESRGLIERVQELAIEKDVTMAQIALAWQYRNDYVDAPIVGTTSVEHVEDAVDALGVDLSDSDAERLAEPCEPMPVMGH